MRNELNEFKAFATLHLIQTGQSVEWLPQAIRRLYPDLFNEQGDMFPEFRERLINELVEEHNGKTV